MRHFDGSKLIKIKIIINKYVNHLKMGYPTDFVDSTQNNNKNKLKIRIVATRQNLQVRLKILKKNIRKFTQNPV
jgi:hypothetical protein